jgi:hypothetical protein
MAARPTESADSPFHEGLALLLAGEAFDAHEVWEDLWLQAGGSRARYLQGWIQLAVALYHWQCGRMAAALRLLERGRLKLQSADEGARNAEPSAQAALDWADRCFAALLETRTGEQLDVAPPLVIPRLDAGPRSGG